MRASGILMPVFSLPGPYGIGTLGDEAFAFVDFLAAAKQTYWQILPIGPTGYGDSPYQSFSAFAGNPYFIDFRLLAADGLLTEAELPAPQPVGPVDYGALYQQRPVVLHKAADRLLASPTPAYEAFCEAQSGWLEDYALFMAVKAEQEQAGLSDWPDDLRTREPAALAAAKARLAAEVDYHKAVQFFFYTQWNALKTYANSHGIQLVGDILAEGQLLSAQLGDCLDAGGVRLYLVDQRTQDEGLRLCAGKQGTPQTADVTDRQLLDLIAQHTQLFFHVRGCQQSAGASGIDPDDVYFQMIPPRLRSWFRG